MTKEIFSVFRLHSFSFSVHLVKAKVKEIEAIRIKVHLHWTKTNARATSLSDLFLGNSMGCSFWMGAMIKTVLPLGKAGRRCFQLCLSFCSTVGTCTVPHPPSLCRALPLASGHVQLGPYWTPPPHTHAHSNLFTWKRWQSESGRLALDWNAFFFRFRVRFSLSVNVP